MVRGYTKPLQVKRIPPLQQLQDYTQRKASQNGDAGLEKKKQIDPAYQLDIDAIIQKNESRQISGFSTEEDQNINPNYD